MRSIGRIGRLVGSEKRYRNTKSGFFAWEMDNFWTVGGDGKSRASQQHGHFAENGGQHPMDISSLVWAGQITQSETKRRANELNITAQQKEEEDFITSILPAHTAKPRVNNKNAWDDGFTMAC